MEAPVHSGFRFLIVGAGRGGTSLLAGLLDEHPGLEVGFELFAADYLMGGKLQASGSDRFHARVSAFIAACEERARLYPNATWGNKITTEHILRLEGRDSARHPPRAGTLDRFFNEHLKGIRIVFILRDGRSCVVSKVLRAGVPIEEACLRWKYSVDVYRFMKTRHGDSICIRFEDLVLQPEATLRAVCRFLGVRYTADMISGTKSKKMRPEYQRSGFDASRAEPAVLPDRYLDIIRADLEYCGYVRRHSSQ